MRITFGRTSSSSTNKCQTKLLNSCEPISPQVYVWAGHCWASLGFDMWSFRHVRFVPIKSRTRAATSHAHLGDERSDVGQIALYANNIVIVSRRSALRGVAVGFAAFVAPVYSDAY